MTPTPVSPKSPRWLRIALFASLAVNLGVAGLVLGAAWHGGGRPMPVRELGFGPFEAALDKTDRAALRAAFLARAGEVGTSRREMRAQMVAILDAVRAEPFDAGALSAAIDTVAARTEARLRIGQSLMIDHLSSLTAAERAAFADRMEAAMRRAHRPGPQARHGNGDR